MKVIQLKTTKGNIAKIPVDIDRFRSKRKDAFISEYLDRYDKALSGVSREKIESALGELWELTYPAKKQDAE